MNNQLKLSNKKCINCDNFIPELRLKALPNTKTCVNCSDVKIKQPVTVTLGEEGHTYNEIIILDDEDYKKYNKIKNKKTGLDEIK